MQEFPEVTLFPNGSIRRDYGDMVVESYPAAVALPVLLRCEKIGDMAVHVTAPDQLTCQCGELRDEAER